MNARIPARAPHTLAALAMLAAVGCRSYEPAPLDLSATRSQWLERSPSDESARQFAERLFIAEDPSGHAPFDPSDGLSLAEAEAVALVFNRGLRIARLEANVARATRDSAGLWEDPVAGVDIERIVSGVDDPWVIAGTIGITIPISGRLEAAKALAGAEYAAQLQRVGAREWALRALLRERWIEWSAQAHRVRITEDLVERLRAVSALSDRLRDAGEIARVDARLFKVQLVGAETDLIAAQARAEELRFEIHDLLGMSPGAPLRLVETMAAPTPTVAPAEALQAMERRNLELAVSRDEYEAAEQALRLEVRKQYPDLTIGPGYGEDQGDERVLIGVRLPIPLWNRNVQGVDEAAAQREAARARFDGEYERLALQLEIAHTRFDAAHAVRRSVESTVLPLADEQEADIRQIAELGQIDPLLTLQALTAQHDAKARLVDARAAESIASIRRELLIGPPLAVPAAQSEPDQPTAPVEGARP